MGNHDSFCELWAIMNNASPQIILNTINELEPSFDQGHAVLSFRNVLEQIATSQKSAFIQHEATIVELVTQHAQFVDQLLIKAWQNFFNQVETLALIAVGGYGRGELHPGSDIDLMILSSDEHMQPHQNKIEEFLTFLWDIGLEVGHSVRSLNDCQHQASSDITVITNLSESRLLIGSPALFANLCELIDPQIIWPGAQFFKAKQLEQKRRHEKFHDIAYNLEPNVKEGPGGLRDIQMLGWVAKRLFAVTSLHDLVTKGFLSEMEYRTLIKEMHYLWRVRFALHIFAGRGENRLLFDHQKDLAEFFGFQDEGPRLAVERFMQSYYRAIKELACLNEMLLQLFQEACMMPQIEETPQALNSRFHVQHGYVAAVNKEIFMHYPFALLEIFLLLQQNPEIKGVHAGTIRLIREHRYLIDDLFCNDRRCRKIFMEIMRYPRKLAMELRRMHRYGILAAYLPVFGNIVGRMQYDLFHTYTVDEHSLFVIENLQRCAVPEYQHERPFCSNLLQRLAKPELLYIAALFHDIAKGRGCDHSIDGAKEVEIFCRDHNLGRYDTRLVAWLIRNHLLLSLTAQRRDISDPDVVRDFAGIVGDQIHLDYLYLLTVADIRATNPNLWNEWKGSLLLDLYDVTKKALLHGFDNTIDQDDFIAETKAAVKRLLKTKAIDIKRLNELFATVTPVYFWRYSAEEIAWHTEAIFKTQPSSLPLVVVRRHPRRGVTEVFLHTKVEKHLFALSTSVLDQIGLTILDARIVSTSCGYTLDSYLVLENSGQPIQSSARNLEICELFKSHHQHPVQPPLTVSRRLSRQIKHFPITTQVNFTLDEKNQRTMMELITCDRPGLLSMVGQAFMKCVINIQNAKITTIGSRVEDIFFITNKQGLPLAPEQYPYIKDVISHLLQEH